MRCSNHAFGPGFVGYIFVVLKVLFSLTIISCFRLQYQYFSW